MEGMEVLLCRKWGDMGMSVEMGEMRNGVGGRSVVSGKSVNG